MIFTTSSTVLSKMTNWKDHIYQFADRTMGQSIERLQFVLCNFSRVQSLPWIISIVNPWWFAEMFWTEILSQSIVVRYIRDSLCCQFSYWLNFNPFQLIAKVILILIRYVDALRVYWHVVQNIGGSECLTGEECPLFFKKKKQKQKSALLHSGDSSFFIFPQGLTHCIN